MAIIITGKRMIVLSTQEQPGTSARNANTLQKQPLAATCANRMLEFSSVAVQPLELTRCWCCQAVWACLSIAKCLERASVAFRSIYSQRTVHAQRTIHVCVA